MSGAQTSSAPNVLFDPLMAGRQQAQQNTLMQQQQELSAADMEQESRAANWLTTLDPSQRPQAYQAAIAQLKAAGFAKNAPAEYPGDQANSWLAQQSLPVADQYKLGIVTPPGTTAAINAALGGNQPAQGGNPPAQGSAPPGSGVTIGQRQNNPGNLTFAGQPGASPGQGNRFASFPDMPTGVAANADQLALYQTQHGINTVRGAVTRWVGDPKADLTSYIGDISKALGVGPDDKIDLTDPTVQAKFIQAQFPHESAGGGYVLNPADVAKGVQMAAANRGRPVQAPGTAVAAVPPTGATPGGVAARTGGVDVAGPGAPTAAPAAPQFTYPNGKVGPAPDPTGLVRYNDGTAGTPPAGTPVPVAAAAPAAPVVAQSGQPPASAPAAPAQPAQPAQPSGPQANLPHASEVSTGTNSPQYRQAMDLQRRAMLLDAQPDPTGRLKTLAAGLRSQAALILQSDSVVQTQEGQVHVLTGAIDKTAAPLADYHETTPGSGIWVGGPGTEPKFQPPGRLVIDKAGNVWQTSVGGAHMLSPTDPQAITALNAAQAQGSATGTDVGKQLPAMIAQARAAAQQEGQIDYATNQLREAAKGGIPSGYFSDALATAAAAAKSLGIDTSSLGVNPQAVGNMQTAQKTLAVIGGAILQQAIGKDSQITNDKIEAFIHTQPGIQNDPQALQRIMAWARSQYTYEREMGQAAVAQAAQSPTGTLPLNWQAQYYHTHGFAPVYDPGTQEMQQPDGRQPARETPPPASTQQQAPALPPDAAAKLKEGVNTHFGNGQTWTLQNGKPVRVQ